MVDSIDVWYCWFVVGQPFCYCWFACWGARLYSFVSLRVSLLERYLYAFFAYWCTFWSAHLCRFLYNFFGWQLVSSSQVSFVALTLDLPHPKPWLAPPKPVTCHTQTLDLPHATLGHATCKPLTYDIKIPDLPHKALTRRGRSHALCAEGSCIFGQY